MYIDEDWHNDAQRIEGFQEFNYFDAHNPLVLRTNDKDIKISICQKDDVFEIRVIENNLNLAPVIVHPFTKGN